MPHVRHGNVWELKLGMSRTRPTNSFHSRCATLFLSTIESMVGISVTAPFDMGDRRFPRTHASMNIVDVIAAAAGLGS